MCVSETAVHQGEELLHLSPGGALVHQAEEEEFHDVMQGLMLPLLPLSKCSPALAVAAAAVDYAVPVVVGALVFGSSFS